MFHGIGVCECFGTHGYCASSLLLMTECMVRKSLVCILMKCEHELRVLPGTCCGFTE